ncbi:MAG: glutamine--tRNA ligase [Halobacteriovoraceae bacterium]|nr:glutamine--tRNA ligase [Halobacteriovoraceae bacterium]|tara:strand:+ start:1847 stop:3541 length:1695 start_codon:yes stop_codon:yes gene_type:complete
MNERIPTNKKEHRNFIENIVAKDLEAGKHEGWVVTRFPPEPNGYLHIGHAKAILLSYGLAWNNAPKSRFHLRFDDTNPEKEETEYVEAIKKDIKWLGADWGENLFFASDYFEKLYGFAVELINKGLAFVDDQTFEEIQNSRGNFETPGTNSPFRERSVEENLKLFQEMREGKYQDGEKVLRAKIDMASNFMCMRDPVLYRIRHVEHHRTGKEWCLYPLYDFTHGLSDAIEGITHSLCSLEFQDNRRLYDWFVENVSAPSRPHQYEFARLNLDYTVMSKRKLLQLVNEKYVDGWDDPRMPTVSGVRRRGYPAAALRNFMEQIGVGKENTVIELSILEANVRDELNRTTKRCMGILDPIKVTLTNWDKEDHQIEAPFHPQDESFGTRLINFGPELYIERSDFLEDPPSPKKWFRLGPGRSVRLRYGYVITCDEYVKDGEGNVTELKCTYHEDSFGGKQPQALEKKVKGIIHWVNAKEAIDTEIRLYDRLFKHPDPGAVDNFLEEINPDSLSIIKGKLEPFLGSAKPGEQFQLERVGYFTADEKLSQDSAPVFNRTVGLKDSWAKKA